MPAKRITPKDRDSTTKSATVSNAGATHESVTKAFSPYLRYTVPEGLAQIKANLQKSINELQLENLVDLAGQAMQGTITAGSIDIQVAPGNTDVNAQYHH